jgi:outer membrane protein
MDLNDFRRSTANRMNRTFVLMSAFAMGLTASVGVAQTAAPQAPATAASPAEVPPQAVPAKIALIQFEQAAAATNEGQRSLQDLQKKYEPKKSALDALAGEIDSLTKQLQAAAATTPDAERASRQRAIEIKQKQYQRDGEDAQNSYGADLQEAIGKVAQKMGPIVIQYVQKNGYTMLLDNTGQQGGVTVLWTQAGTDISQAVVDAYNTSSGVAAPVPSAPSASRPRPASATPRPAAPKAAAPKP